MSYKIVGLILEPASESPIMAAVIALMFLLLLPALCCNETAALMGKGESIIMILVRGRPLPPQYKEAPPRDERIKQAPGEDAINKRAFVKTNSKSGILMRKKSTINSPALMRLYEGAEVTILFYDERQSEVNSQSGRWCYVSYNGQKGWIWGWELEVR